MGDKPTLSVAELKARMDELRVKMDELRSKIELKSPKDLVSATENSVRGFLAVLFTEKAFRTDLVVFAVSAGVCFAIPGLSWCERALMVYTAFIPLVAELINTAIEKIIDRISTDYHRLSGLAKDIGSALVSASFVGAVVCWAIVLTGWGLRFFAK